MTKLTPLADRILVQPLPEAEVSKGGIIIPDNAREKPTRGRVIATGPGRRNANGERVAMDVTQGETVLYGKYSGTEVKLDGETYVIIAEGDVLGSVQE